MTAVPYAGVPVRLFDARDRQVVQLPPPERGPVVLEFAHPAVEPPGLTQRRGTIIADILRRLLLWKGYEVQTAHRDPAVRQGGNDAWRARLVDGYPIDIVGPEPEVLCHLLVGRVEPIRHFCARVLWHREAREPTLPDLTDLGVAASDFRLAMVMAGHYRRPRRFLCCTAHDAGFLDDARNTRRRLERLAHDLGPLPSVPTFVTATSLVPTFRAGSNDLTPGFREISDLDAMLCEDLHTPRAIAALHVALRHRFATLSGNDRRVLLAAAQVLLGLNLGP